jgi:phosphoglycolate phosphatase-like HAD superfamily hydrolase
LRRLLLFDIDGTLVLGGPAKRAFQVALVDTFGTAGAIEVHNFAGKTDPQIARELLRGAGLNDADIDAGFPRLWPHYLGHLEEWLPAHPMRVLPGVPALLGALADYPDVGVGLMTGNIVRGAELKLGSAGLWEHFRMGSYGSDHEERDELAPIALRRARETWGVSVPADEVLVVGDTPKDVQCGRKTGMRTVGVATGRYAVSDLEGAGADHVLLDLSDTEEVLSLLTG